MPSSKLQEHVASRIHELFPFLSVLENVRPEWLTDERGRRLELDIFLEEIRLAIEIQGVQHFSYVEHFHGDAVGFEDQKERDSAKRAACYAEGVVLLEIVEEAEVEPLMDTLRKRLLPNAPPTRLGPPAAATSKTYMGRQEAESKLHAAINRAVLQGIDTTLTITVRVNCAGEVLVKTNDPMSHQIDRLLGLTELPVHRIVKAA